MDSDRIDGYVWRLSTVVLLAVIAGLRILPKVERGQAPPLDVRWPSSLHPAPVRRADGPRCQSRRGRGPRRRPGRTASPPGPGPTGTARGCQLTQEGNHHEH